MHAYLIMAHNDFSILEKSLLLLDDTNNDFYIHIDKKAKEFDFKYFSNLVKYSNIYFINRRNIQWGSYNIIRTEMDLFKAAYPKKYDVYHLLSGSDMPIVTKEFIKNFFENYPNTEFINIVTKNRINKYDDRTSRFKYYHFFNNYGINKFGMKKLDNLFINIQKKLKVDRYKNDYLYYFGSEWVSLSNDGVSALIKNDKWIKKIYRNTHCCDEIYKQTVLMKESCNIFNAPNSSMRYIKWSDGDNVCHPSILRMNDLDSIKKSGCLFARKFSSKEDMEVVDYIYDSLNKKNKI